MDLLPNAMHYPSDWWHGAVVHGRPTEWWGLMLFE
jgi:hypothetical protein